MKEIAQKLNITTTDDWYHVTHTSLIRHGAAGLLSQYNYSIFKLVKAVYPEYLCVNIW